MNDNLTRREEQVAELVAWGAAYKEVPDLLKKKYGGREISLNTVKRTMENIFSKLYINKVNELSAWWFCHRCGVDESLSPFKEFKKTLYSILFLVIITPQIASANLDQAVRLIEIQDIEDRESRTFKKEGGMIEMTEKRLRMINSALCAYIARLESNRQALDEDDPSFRQFTALIDEYTSLKEDIEILLLRY